MISDNPVFVYFSQFSDGREGRSWSGQHHATGDVTFSYTPSSYVPERWRKLYELYYAGRHPDFTERSAFLVVLELVATNRVPGIAFAKESIPNTGTRWLELAGPREEAVSLPVRLRTRPYRATQSRAL
jgi:hypothetical protein